MGREREALLAPGALQSVCLRRRRSGQMAVSVVEMDPGSCGLLEPSRTWTRPWNYCGGSVDRAFVWLLGQMGNPDTEFQA